MISTRMRNSPLHCDNEVIDEVLKVNTLPHTLQFSNAQCERREAKWRMQQICGAVSRQCGTKVSDGRAMVEAIPVRAATWNVGLLSGHISIQKSGCQVKRDCQLAVTDGRACCCCCCCRCKFAFQWR